MVYRIEPLVTEYVCQISSMVFETADLLDAMSTAFGHSQPLGNHLCEFTSGAYRSLEETVKESIWLKEKIKDSQVLVRNHALRSESPEPMPDFVANLMRAYRNGHHGYFATQKEKRPSRYLFLVDGNLPGSLVRLPPLWLLAYLIDPGMVGWSPLGRHDRAGVLVTYDSNDLALASARSKMREEEIDRHDHPFAKRSGKPSGGGGRERSLPVGG